MAMPVRTRPEDVTAYRDEHHWQHVMEHLFIPAVEAAGFRPIRPVSKGSSMIHADIVGHLEQADMVLCDFSGLNANVFFELGVRTSLDRPMALVHDSLTRIPFDLGPVNAHEYPTEWNLKWNSDREIQRLADHLKEAEKTCDGKNPLWTVFGLTKRAQESVPDESPLQASLALLREEVSNLGAEVRAQAENAQVSRPFRATPPSRIFAISTPAANAADKMNDYAKLHGLPLRAEPAFDGEPVVNVDAVGADPQPIGLAHSSLMTRIAIEAGAEVAWDPPLLRN